MNERALRVLEFDKLRNMLAGLTSSELGRRRVLTLFPVNAFEEVSRRLNETDEALSLMQRRGEPSLSANPDIREAVKRMELGAILNQAELLMLGASLKTARNLKTYIHEEPEGDHAGDVISKILTLFTRKTLEERIFSAIISEDEMDDHASSTLLSLRRQILHGQNSIREKLNQMIRSSKYQKYIQDPVVTIRQGRQCISVKKEHRQEIQGLIHDTSASGATIFIEPMSVVEANNEIKQLQVKEQQEIERILAEITEEASAFHAEFLTNLELLTELDFVFSKAKLAMSYHGVKPRLNRDKKIEIKKGRHPFIPHDRVVPIDFHIGEEFGTAVVTGPNTGGKTVSLKTVGLFTLMTQAGLFVPANEGTKMAVFQDIFADIGDEQSIEQSLSTFSSHMKNIVEIVSEANTESLVLFDELGAGTDPTEGASLAMAILEYLQNKSVITIATTHYAELKVFAMTRAGVLNASCEFDVETLMPTYRLLIGIPGKSNAYAIAKRLGLQEEILDRAKKYLTQDEIKMEDMLYSIRKKMDDTEKNRLEAETALKSMQREETLIKERTEKLERDKLDILKKAKEEALKIIKNAKEDAGFIIKELHELRTKELQKEHFKEADAFHKQLSKMESEIEEKNREEWKPNLKTGIGPQDVKPGDTVQIEDIQQSAIVLSTPNKEGEVLLQVGAMKLNLPLHRLRKERTDKKGTPPSFKGIAASKTKVIKPEVDVRGLVLDDAVEIVDKYLDDAVLAGLQEVRIIHGKGTGVLRAGLMQYCKNHPHIQEYRSGKYGEGEMGVTIVELK